MGATGRSQTRLAAFVVGAVIVDLAPFLAEQERFRSLARASRLPLFELDVSDDDPTAQADRLVDWLATTNGLAWPWGLPPDEVIADT